MGFPEQDSWKEAGSSQWGREQRSTGNKNTLQLAEIPGNTGQTEQVFHPFQTSMHKAEASSVVKLHEIPSGPRLTLSLFPSTFVFQVLKG